MDNRTGQRASGESPNTTTDMGIRKGGPIMQVCRCESETAMTPYIETSWGVAYVCGTCKHRRFRSWAAIAGDLADHLGLPLGRVAS